MALVGFRATAVEGGGLQTPLFPGPPADIDVRGTPRDVFLAFERRFGFTVDVCALPDNAKCRRYFTPDDDGLAQSWRGERVWCNPPYSNIEPWVEKASQGDAELVAMLLPANRTEQGWWHRWIEPQRLTGALSVEFLRGRIKFHSPHSRQHPPFGCCLVIWGE